MKHKEFINELKKRGFIDGECATWKKDNIEVQCYGGLIVDGWPFPYTLKLNGKAVIGNQRCLNYIDQLLQPKLNVLFYHAGSDCLGKYFKLNGHNVIDIVIDIDNTKIPYYNILTGFNYKAMTKEYGKIDVLLVNPNCKSYSNNGIAHHRRKHEGKWYPHTHLAHISDKWNKDIVDLIKELKPRVYVIENPRGYLSKSDFMSEIPRYQITYFSYDPTRYKPTTIFTNIINPQFYPPASLKDIRNHKIQSVKYQVAKDSSKQPDKLVKYIYEICMTKEVM